MLGEDVDVGDVDVGDVARVDVGDGTWGTLLV